MILVKGYRIGMKEENQYEDAVFEGNFEGYDVYVSYATDGLDMEEVINKPVIGELVRKRMFKRYILLKKGMMGKISAVFDDRGNVIY